MIAPFTVWPSRVAAATDERALRGLLAEIGRWRLDRLSDLHAQREALWAMSQTYHLLGDHERALHEANQCLSLVRMPPVAAREVQHFVERHHQKLTRKSEPHRPDDRWERALAAAHAGHFEEARAQAGRGKGPRLALFRVWTRLAEAMAQPGEAREAALVSLERELASRFELGSSEEEHEPAESAPEAPARREARPPRAAAPPVEGTPLSELVGAAVPGDRDELVIALDAWLAEHPDQVDALAAAALRHHVQVAGKEAVAPWLAGFTARALALSEGTLVRAAMNELAGSWALTLYAEGPFQLAVDAVRAAEGATFVSLRRGLSRGGREESSVWTLRLVQQGEECLAAICPADLQPDARLAGRVVERVRGLCERAVIVTTSATLRQAALAVQVGVADPTPAAVVAAMAAAPKVVRAAPERAGRPERVAPAERAPRAERAPQAERAERAPRAERPERAERPDDSALLTRIGERFHADPMLPEGEWSEILSGLGRSWRAFLPLRTTLETWAGDVLDARLAPFLRALHGVTPEGIRLAEATTWALRVAASHPDGEVAQLLRGDDAVSQRFGGPRIAALVAVAGALAAEGWQVARVLDGITRKESRRDAALGPLSEAATGLWRLLVRKGEQRGEIWFVDRPSPEARAAVPLLLLHPQARVLVVPADEAPLALPPTVRPIRWTGAEGAEVVAAAASFPEGGEEDLG